MTLDGAVPAELPARLGARAIDALVLLGMGFGLGRVLGFGLDWLALVATTVLAYFVMLDVVAGTTLGKLVLGLRVVGREGRKPSLREALVRELFTVLGAMPFVGPLLALAAWIWLAATIRRSPLRQGKHDMLAGGTRVVRLRGADKDPA